MTEEEWLACEDPARMVQELEDKVSDRRLRLLGCACCRLLQQPITHIGDLGTIALVEADADGPIHLLYATGRPNPDEIRSPVQCLNLQNASDSATAAITACVELEAPERSLRFWAWKHQKQRRRFYSSIVRDIFGNPFRPATFDPAWRTDTALALARQMYDAREFSAMPILADALQDAGCDSDDILNHCREAVGGSREPGGGPPP